MDQKTDVKEESIETTTKAEEEKMSEQENVQSESGIRDGKEMWNVKSESKDESASTTKKTEYPPEVQAQLTEIRDIKNQQKTFAGWVTRTSSAIQELMTSPDNLDTVKTEVTRIQ